ncbi:unnamed protein product [Miscanthus lutarioriparius]|uniref:Uncharacterized protein n=1 Tax=Miscanthus lutarioriparius TaxID=422564 RepID=A0A811NY71_9POAL|nr:unnamed protein product [Miscanthus lutarioriparius]
MCLDHVDFSHRHVSDTFPRIGVWKQNMIRDFSDLDIKSLSGYGMRPLLDFEKTFYHKAFTSQQESVSEASDVAEFLSKLEADCGCDVPDSLKASLSNVIEEHCKGCLPYIPVDLVSLGALHDDLKTMFSKLMNHVYSFKQKSHELVIKVLKEFVDYESSSDPHIASPKMAAALGNVNGFHQPHDSQVNIEKVERASSLAMDLVAPPVGTQFGGQAVMGVAPGSSSKCVPSSSKKQVTFGLAVSPNDLSQPYYLFYKSVRRGHLVGKSSSQTVPAHVVDDVIHVAKDHDFDVLAGGFNSPDHFTIALIVMQTLSFSDDESPNITPKLSKKLPPISQLKPSSKAGLLLLLLISLSQKLRSMGKKSEILYNSKLQNSSSSVHTPRESVLKIGGHPSLIPNQFAQSSSKSDFKISESSTGGKVPLHGPRRTVKPSQYMGDEFEIEKGKFKVRVRCTFWALGESLKPGGFVMNFVIAAFCYHLYSQPFGHPDVSKCHYFFSSISDQLLKDTDTASEDILNRAFTITACRFRISSFGERNLV